MKILLVHNFYRSSAPSGENAVFEAERELLRSRGHEVLEFTRHSDDLARAGALGTLRGALAAPWNPFAVRAVRRVLVRERPDVLHAHNTFPLISPAVFGAARGLRTATVLTLHNYRTFCAAAIPMRDGQTCTECLDRHSVGPALRYGCYRGSRLATAPLAFSIALHRALGTWRRDVDAFISLTEFQREKLVAAGLPGEKVSVKPHFYANPPVPRPWAERDARAVFIGRLGEEKGVRFLVEAWRLWGESAPRLELIGEGPERPLLETVIREAGLTGRVILRGQLPFAQAQETVAQSRLLILPSICFEGFPMVIREAYALGVPVAASRLGSMAELVEEGRTGVLFEPGDARPLLEAVRAAWEAPEALEAMGAGAREAFEAHYTAQANYQMLVRIYEGARARRLKAGGMS
ncbi:MAG: glycosyltransferase family 4 protein [Acidobacteriota bacterium]